MLGVERGKRMRFLLLAALIAASAPPERAVIELVKAQLKDADSAKFKGIKQTGDQAWCGWVNAKNAYGGYTGFQVFFVKGSKVAILTPELSEPSLC